MFKRFNELNFVIGLFFTIVSIVLLGDFIFRHEGSGRLTLYTGLVFLLFGVFMMLMRGRESEE